MKFLVAIVLTALTSFAGALFFPWWIVAVAAFIVSVIIPQQPFKAFLAGFLSLFLLWGIQSYVIDVQNEHILSARVAEILLGNNSYSVLILITALIGGLVAGMAALTGSFIRVAGSSGSGGAVRP